MHPHKHAKNASDGCCADEADFHFTVTNGRFHGVGMNGRKVDKHALTWIGIIPRLTYGCSLALGGA